MPRDGIHRLLSDLELTRLQRLFVSSRFTVEGQLQGAHASPQKGFSVEFADYRQYVPGDDLRHLDWRVYGRSERLYIRQYEEECNLRLYLLVDGSRSMAYAHEGASKYRFASRLAASLAYVTAQQQDSVGLTLFAEQTEAFYPAKGGLAHLRVLANALAEHEPAGETLVASNLQNLAERIPRRALVVILSDLYDEPDAIHRALAQLRRRRHDVVVYQVLDRAEVEFPFRDLGNFQDLELGTNQITNPRDIRHAYLEQFGNFLNRVQGACTALDVDYNLVTTDQPVARLVQRHLQRRQRLAG